ncbi:RNA ligase [uncultured Campylobacter sp.]|uniref:RNA ligase n=1 Tax=uncultured Campylobacter sp. TaxID=218934 RepID=UPI00261E230C|nr:RNA ligase [uncultured Campylobacter sp.]
MRKFIVVRGHAGSGKTTFAKEKIKEFKNEYPQAQIYHLENDMFLTDEAGVYTWSPKLLEDAKRKVAREIKQAYKFALENKDKDVLIVLSNVSARTKELLGLKEQAAQNGFIFECFRMQNFFASEHGVDEDTVIAMFIKVANNKIEGEILIPPVNPMSESVAQKIKDAAALNRRDLPFDAAKNTYVTKKYIAATQDKRLWSARQSELYPELRTYKYSKRVFFKADWDKALLEMRGLIMDENLNIIVRPFKKVYNYSEFTSRKSLYPIDITDDTPVLAVRKVNGFLGCCTYVDIGESGASFNRRVIYSTTGSTDSRFAQMAREHCCKFEEIFKRYPNKTFLFEITDESDPHIVEEEPGETFIGLIDAKTGAQESEFELDKIAASTAAALKRPFYKEGEQYLKTSFAELKNIVKEAKFEGFMVYIPSQNDFCFKMKTPYYLVNKFFARSKNEALSGKLDKTKLDEEFHPLVDHIKANEREFRSLDEQGKLGFIKEFLEKV